MMADDTSPFPPQVQRTIAVQSLLAHRAIAGCTADDLAQEAALACWRALQEYDDTRGASCVTFLRAHSTWAIIDAVRSSTHYGNLRYIPLDPDIAAPFTHADVLLAKTIRRAVNALPGRMRTIMIRRFWRGWTQDRIARQLGCSPSLVCQLERRARVLLRSALYTIQHLPPGW